MGVRGKSSGSWGSWFLQGSECELRGSGCVAPPEFSTGLVELHPEGRKGKWVGGEG